MTPKWSSMVKQRGWKLLEVLESSSWGSWNMALSSLSYIAIHRTCKHAQKTSKTIPQKMTPSCNTWHQSPGRVHSWDSMISYDILTYPDFKHLLSIFKLNMWLRRIALSLHWVCTSTLMFVVRTSTSRSLRSSDMQWPFQTSALRFQTKSFTK